MRLYDDVEIFKFENNTKLLNLLLNLFNFIVSIFLFSEFSHTQFYFFCLHLSFHSKFFVFLFLFIEAALTSLFLCLFLFLLISPCVFLSLYSSRLPSYSLYFFIISINYNSITKDAICKFEF